MAQETTTTFRNNLLDNHTLAIWISAHTASPGLTGANEVSGGSPAYARLQGTFAAASAGQRALSSSVTLDIPASTTVAWLGGFDAVTAGNFLAQDDITDEVFGAQGTLEVTAFTLDLTINPP